MAASDFVFYWAPIPSFGSGAPGYARVNNSGELTDISINETGSSYKFENPHVTIQVKMEVVHLLQR